MLKLVKHNSTVYFFCMLLLGHSGKSEVLEFFGWKINLTEEFFSQKLNSKVRSSNGLIVGEIELFLRESKKAGVDKLVVNLKNEISKNNIGDFASIELIKSIANKFYKNNVKLKRLLVWYLLQELGYDSLLQFSDNQAIVFCKMNIHFEKISFMEVQNGFYTDIFYDTTIYPEKMFNYPPDTVSIGKQVVLNEKTLIDFPINNNVKKEVCFNFNTKNYSLKYKVNKNLVDFFDILPNINYWSIYPSGFGISSSAKDELVKFFRKEISKLDTLSGISFLLNFCQQIKYSDDLVIWKKEKYLFPEQMLFYLVGDCDDKSILMSFLLKELYGLNSVGITYVGQNHMNLAVKIKPSLKDKTVDFKNEKFVVLEPSGTGWKVGQCRPELDFSKIELIN